MKTLALLIAKDLRRTFRNPWPWLLNLALPLAITAVIGFAFGDRAKGRDEGARIKIAVVDEDQSFISKMLRSMFTQQKASAYLDSKIITREKALEELRQNKISAILAIPTNFSTKYVSGEQGLKLEVIKNPAQSFMPAIVEEMAGVIVTTLNTVSRNFQGEFPRIRSALGAGDEIDWGQMLDVFGIVGKRIKEAKLYIDPPLVWYDKNVTDGQSKPAPVPSVQSSAAKVPSSNPPKIKLAKNFIANVFGYILPGMASAFLLFMADHSMRDYHRELRMKTVDRQRAAGASSFVFIAAKILFTAVTVIIGATILFTAGRFIFGIDWQRPDLMALACAAYALFAAGLLAALAALSPSERRTNAMNSMLIFSIAFIGGSYVPSDNFPPFMREHVCPLMPNFWFIEASRSLQFTDQTFGPALIAVLKLGAVGVILGIAAAFLIDRRLNAGARE